MTHGSGTSHSLPTLGEALAALQRSDLVSARTLLRRLCRRNPRAVEPRQLLGLVGLQAGEPAQAIRLLRDAAALAPDSAPVRTNLALAYLAAGAPRILARASSWAGRCWRWLPAAECIQRFLETEPDDGDARLNLARAHQGAGRWQDALDGYQRVLAACPQDEDAQLRLATGLLALGQLESALRAIQGALQGAPELTVTALKARTTAGRGVGWLNVEMLAAALRGRP